MLVQSQGKYLDLKAAAKYLDFIEYSDRVVATAIGLDPGWSSAFGVGFVALLDDFRIVLYRYEVFRRTPLRGVLGICGVYALQRPDVWGVDPIMFNHSWQTGQTDAELMIEEGLRPVAVSLPTIQRQSFMLRLWATSTDRPMMVFDARMVDVVALLSETGRDPEAQHCFDAVSYGAYALITEGKPHAEPMLFGPQPPAIDPLSCKGT